MGDRRVEASGKVVAMAGKFGSGGSVCSARVDGRTKLPGRVRDRWLMLGVSSSAWWTFSYIRMCEIVHNCSSAGAAAQTPGQPVVQTAPLAATGRG